MLKEGVEYRIKISFKVREQPGLLSLCVYLRLLYAWRCYSSCTDQSLLRATVFPQDVTSPLVCCVSQVNKEIVSGLKYVQLTTRKGVKGKFLLPWFPGPE